jgi:streptogramin lyase
MRHGETWWRRLGRSAARAETAARPARVFRPGPAVDVLEDRKLMTLQVATLSAPAVPFTTQSLTFASDGNLWFTEPMLNKIGKMTPQGVVTQYNLPVGTSSSGGITSGPDGNVWFTEKSAIGRITPTGTVTQFNLPATADLTGITSGPDGNLWFMDTNNDKIGRITPSGVVTEFSLPPVMNQVTQSGVVLSHDITSADGDLWYTAEVYNHQTDTMSGVIGKVTTSGVVTQYKLPPPPKLPTSANSNKAGTAPVGGLLADAITAGPNDSVWFTAHQTNGLAVVGQVTPAGKFSMSLIPYKNFGSVVPPIATDITYGPDGNLWFNITTDDFLNGPTPMPYFGRVTPEGKVTEYAIPAAKDVQAAVLSAGADSLIAGPYGGIWFAGISRQFTSSTGRVIGLIAPPKDK